jgi:5-methyltetrahydrofolate--homocysteine methyltransferase
MIIIGERINSTRKSIKKAIDEKDSSFLLEEARLQLEAKADFIDINCAASLDKEAADLIWLIGQVQDSLNCKVSIDSPNPRAIKEAIKKDKSKAFINSITAEKEKMDILLPLAKNNGSFVVALTMDEGGMPQSVEERISLADKIIDAAEKAGLPKQNIYIDPLVRPISTEPEQAGNFLNTVKELKARNINTVGGLSNVSFGLPRRNLLNAAFLKLAREAGIDAAIIDPTDTLSRLILEGKELPGEPFSLARAALLGEDHYSINYIRAFRENKFNNL